MLKAFLSCTKQLWVCRWFIVPPWNLASRLVSSRAKPRQWGPAAPTIKGRKIRFSTFFCLLCTNLIFSAERSWENVYPPEKHLDPEYQVDKLGHDLRPLEDFFNWPQKQWNARFKLLNQTHGFKQGLFITGVNIHHVRVMGSVCFPDHYLYFFKQGK